MARKSNYADISSREQLDRALRELESEINARGVKTGADYEHVKSFYTPANIYYHLMEGVTPLVNMAAVVADFFDRVRQRVEEMRDRRRNGRTEQPETEQCIHEEDQNNR